MDAMQQLAEMELPPQLRFPSFQGGSSPYLDLRPLQATVPPSFLSPNYCPLTPAEFAERLQHASLTTHFLKPKSLQALNSSECSAEHSVHYPGQWSIWVDGSDSPSIDPTSKTPADTSRAGWSFVLCYHPRQESPSSYQIIELAFGPVLDRDLSRYGSHRQGSEVAEAIAIHHAIQRATLLAGPVTIFFDSKLAALASFGVAEPSLQIQGLCRASRGLVLWCHRKNAPVQYQHVKSHIGYPLNELADDLAKLGARQFYSAESPIHLFPEWCDQDSAVADWSWLVNLSPAMKAALGLPGVEGNLIPFPPEVQPSREHLVSLIQDSLPPPTSQGARFIKLSIGTLNVGGLKNFEEN